jgi:hypothetical protein
MSFLFMSHQAFAGKLDEFEEKATQEKKKPSQDEGVKESEPKDKTSDDGCLGGVLKLYAELLAHAVLTSGKASWTRIQNDFDSNLPSYKGIRHRKPGESLIPFVRFDYGYQNVDSDIDASDYRIEFGYGPFGFQVRKTSFVERNPDDKLDFNQLHALYRMSIGNRFELDLGLGVFEIEGNERNSGFSLTVPFLFHPNEIIGVELRPVWTQINGNSIVDFDMALLCGWRYFSVRAGYKSVWTTGASLNGPYIGISLRY